MANTKKETLTKKKPAAKKAPAKAKPVAKKAPAKPVAKKATTTKAKPAAKKAPAKTVAKKPTTAKAKPVAKKTTAKAKPAAKKAPAKSKIALDVKSITTGTVDTLESLKDGVFSKKVMGDGVVVKFPESLKKGEIYAPVSGELVTVFPTKHAYGIKTESGVEVLIHIGIDTVNLKGKGFKSFVYQGDKVEAGDKLAKINLKFVRKNAPSANPIVIVTSGEKVISKAKDEVTLDTVLFSV